ncbi:variable surface protein [Plasmodium gonderi]|uniref:Variable surface protein n=1 Tax=Plasmodium gonderi TaxID=77519 RepID=A0A1Y1JSU9_PLAGO|nr:variable surface protein [Plasmodium gonderi]GAW84508.1 variable surface protein [Plasmodium gonderi]
MENKDNNSIDIPPKEFTKELLKHVNIRDLVNKIKTPSIDISATEYWVNGFNSSVISSYNILKNKYNDWIFKEQRCNAMNYYLNLITSAIYASNISNTIRDETISSELYSNWQKRYYCDNCDCYREETKYSTHINLVLAKLKDNSYDHDIVQNLEACISPNIAPVKLFLIVGLIILGIIVKSVMLYKVKEINS